ncbi:MAG TPA: hypothetical protein VMV90_07195 [Rectinemataceae bacterium]|nr:hypothetical protein [Rectinemataceae bacterium]
MLPRILGQGLSVTPAAVVALSAATAPAATAPEAAAPEAAAPEATAPEAAASGAAAAWPGAAVAADSEGAFDAAAAIPAVGDPGDFVVKGSNSNTTTAAAAMAIRTGKRIRGKGIGPRAGRSGRFFGA